MAAACAPSRPGGRLRRKFRPPTHRTPPCPLDFPPPPPYLLTARAGLTFPSRRRRWGCSSVGRALRSQCRGQEFEPPQLHQPNQALRRKRTSVIVAMGADMGGQVGFVSAPRLNRRPDRISGGWRILIGIAPSSHLRPLVSKAWSADRHQNPMPINTVSAALRAG